MKQETLEILQDMLGYELWASQRLVQTLLDLRGEEYTREFPIPFHHMQGLFAHLHYYTQKLSQALLKETVDKKSDLSQEKMCQDLIAHLERCLSYLKDCDELDPGLTKKIVSLCAHNNYHRGQIHNLLSILGHEPPSLDIYLFQNERMTEDERFP